MKLKDESSWDKRQIKAIDNWYKNKNGVITAYTGFGKTRGLAFRAIQRLINENSIPESILVSVPSFKLKQDWEDLL
jgi:superfamily II DNA or RNA helicase